MLTQKENYLRVLHGEMPEWVPMHTQNLGKGQDVNECASLLFTPSILTQHVRQPGTKDIWGVSFVGCAEADGSQISDPNHRILPDITKWRDVIKAPDLSDIDWEMMAKKDLERTGINREKTVVTYNSNFGMFQTMMSFMGFTDGLMALYEEPEEVHALLDYLCDFYCGIIEKSMDYYKPEAFTIKDDTAGIAPFISLDMFKEFFLPLYDRFAKYARDRGLPISFHNCGTSMHFIEEVIKIGVVVWEPAQAALNDLGAFKAKYGRSCAICGGWINRDELLADDITDEMIYENVKNTFDHWAPGGGFLWYGSLLGGAQNPEIQRKNALIKKYVKEIGADYYK